MIDLIIIGGGTAGMTAALYARRAEKTVLLLEKETFGGQIASSPKVENYPGIPSVSGIDFSNALHDQIVSAGALVKRERVTAVTKTNGAFTVTTTQGEYVAKSIIIATGVKKRKLGAKGEDQLAGAGVSYCAVCDGAFFKNCDVAVIGGGSSALTSAVYLSAMASKVYLIHRRDTFRGEEAMVAALRQKSNVEFVLSDTVQEFLGEDELTGIKLASGKTLAVEGAFVTVGQVADNEIFRGLVDLDQDGYVVAGEDTMTKTAGVYAAGDCRTKDVRQLATAAADGAVAALKACAYADRQ